MKLPRPSAHRYTSPYAKALAWLADIVAALAVVAALWFGVWIWNIFKPRNYSADPPAQVLRAVLNGQSARGISNLRVAGIKGLSAATAWIKCSASDESVNALLASKKLAFDGPQNELVGVTKEMVQQDLNARAVGWDERLRLKRIEAYQYRFVPAGTGWDGVLIVDRDRHTLYIEAGLL